MNDITIKEVEVAITEDTMTLADAICIRDTMFSNLDKNQPGSSDLLKLSLRRARMKNSSKATFSSEELRTSHIIFGLALLQGATYQEAMLEANQELAFYEFGDVRGLKSRRGEKEIEDALDSLII